MPFFDPVLWYVADPYWRMVSLVVRSLLDGFLSGFFEYDFQWTVAPMLLSLSPPVLNLTRMEKPSRSVVVRNLSNYGFVIFFLDVVDVELEGESGSCESQDEIAIHIAAINKSKKRLIFIIQINLSFK